MKTHTSSSTAAKRANFLVLGPRMAEVSYVKPCVCVESRQRYHFVGRNYVYTRCACIHKAYSLTSLVPAKWESSCVYRHVHGHVATSSLHRISAQNHRDKHAYTICLWDLWIVMALWIQATVYLSHSYTRARVILRAG